MVEWTIYDVASRFCEAARTAHRLPPVRVQGFFNVWPPFLRTEFEQMACEDPPRMHFRPAPAEIERMLEVMHWVQWLDVEKRHLVWMRAEKFCWNEIAKRFGHVPRTAQRHWHVAMHTVVCRLSAEN